MGKDDSKALTDLGLDELDVATTSSAANTDYVIYIPAGSKVPELMTIANLDKLIS